MKNQQPIKYILIGNSKTIQEIGEYPNKQETSTSKSAKNIFQGYCQNESRIVYDQRHEIKNVDDIFYFTVSTDKIFYLVSTEKTYSSRYIWELITEITRDNIHLLVDEKGELHKIGKHQLKTLVDSYQKHNTIGKLQAEVQEVKIELNQNYRKLINNIDNVEELQKKANNIKDISKEYNKEAANLRKETCCRNFKWTIILIVLVIGVVFLIVVPIVASSSKSDTNKNNSNQNNSTDSNGNSNGTLLYR